MIHVMIFENRKLNEQSFSSISYVNHGKLLKGGFSSKKVKGSSILTDVVLFQRKVVSCDFYENCFFFFTLSNILIGLALECIFIRNQSLNLELLSSFKESFESD